MMKTIKQVLATKGNQVFTTAPNTLIVDAVKEMAKKKVGALIVLLNDEIKGVITEQDFTRRVILEDIDVAKTLVQDVMTHPVSIIQPEQNINEGMAIMTEKRIRHLPVIEDNKLIGLISIGDLVKEVISEQETIIEHLEHYIHS
jgi:CBS domain-containing protein